MGLELHQHDGRDSARIGLEFVQALLGFRANEDCPRSVHVSESA